MESGRVYTALYNRLKSPLLARVGSGCAKAVFRLPIRARAALCRRTLPIRGKAELAGALEAVYPRPAASKAAVRPLAPASGIDLSVLLPAYNCEAWVAGCVRSVLEQQTRFSFELIAVNDGSTDGTLAALQSVRDARLRVINRPNGGASAARNAAIEAAGGRYLMFVDADDLLLPGALQALLSQAEASGADVVQGSWRYLEGGRPGQRYPDGPCPREASLGFAGTPWAKLYRRTLFEQVRFPEGYRSFVDTI
ncbi:MAG: glycosyltransferase family A protein, partial [Eubacteriales bacterium]|nr:glycosyltransferase family A protein [Eubacteriales bacterium]